MKRAVLVGVLVGCGARTMPGAPEDESVDDAGRRDAGRVDAGRVDAGRDAGPRDGGRDAGPVLECRADRDCGEGFCVGDLAAAGTDLDPMPLRCDELGPGVEEGAECDFSEECGRGLCVVAGTCVRPCADDDDCELPGERCAPVYVRTGPEALQPLTACVDRWNVPPGVVADDALSLPLTGSFAGETIALPAVTPTTVVMLEPQAGRIHLSQLRTRGASPMVLFDVEAIGFGTPSPLNPTYPEAVPVTIMLPNGPRSVLSDAGFEADLFSDVATDLRVIQVTGDGGQVLNLDLYYVGPRGWRPTGARGPREVADALAGFEDRFEAAGIRIGEVRQHEVVGQLRRRFQIIDADDDFTLPEFEDMFELTAGTGRPSVSIFFVREIDGALGIAGGAPGPPGVHGTRSSGIAIAVDLLGSPGLPEDIDLARTISHEIGHYLGLFHTSEFDGTVIEPLPDTPECRTDRDTDGDGFLLPEECAGAGADNLMFWAAAGDTLTEDQGDVVVRVPVLLP